MVHSWFLAFAEAKSWRGKKNKQMLDELKVLKALKILNIYSK